MSLVAENRTTESRLLAGICHASVVLQGLGILVGVVVYATQREKSRFAAFHALQAALYQLITLILVMVLWVVWGIFYTLTFIPLVRFPDAYSDAPPPLFWVGMGSMLIPLAIMVIFGLIGLWGGLRTWLGHDFRYPLIGGWLARSGLWNGNGGGAAGPAS